MASKQMQLHTVSMTTCLLPLFLTLTDFVHVCSILHKHYKLAINGSLIDTNGQRFAPLQA